jgi:outer membrane receptor protein involved in Fe transport
VLVDGVAWVNESSASGVSGSADLNTIPMAIVERVEVLEDGASAIYGSDAIAGVINIITRRTFDGAEANAYYGQYDDGGETTDISLTLGGSGERWSGVFTASYFEQEDISSASWDQSAVPEPGARSGRWQLRCPAGPLRVLRSAPAGRRSGFLRRCHQRCLVLQRDAQRRHRHAGVGSQQSHGGTTTASPPRTASTSRRSTCC